MKTEILKIFSESIYHYLSIAPKTKTEVKYISLFEYDVTPMGLINFMRENNIPEDAEFSGNVNCYDSYDDFGLSWHVTVDTNDSDITKYIKGRINLDMFKKISEVYLQNGFKRSRCIHSPQLKEYSNTTVYDMYMKGEHDRLVNYYNLYFERT